MKLSLNWLRDYVRLDGPVDEICRAVTLLGFEVEQVIATGAPKVTQVIVGQILTRARHPNADKLSVCSVDIGAGGVKTIVCGASNCDAPNRVPVALPGAVLPGNFVIKQSKIRGELSDGMMCSAKELGLSDESAGLLILDGFPALGTPINNVLPAGDTVLDIEITPNRPDCLSHLGMARELAAWFKQDLVYPAPKTHLENPAADRPDLLSSVRVDSPEDCPFYTAHIITGIKVGPSPAWLQERLRAVGLRPINNVVDVGNYVMLELGQPMHAFDARKLGGGEIVVRRAAEGETITTLDAKPRTLTCQMLVIADAIRPVVIAGIMGGENSGVSSDTTDLVIEGAYFKRQSIRTTSKRLALSSDSSYRYERGVDPHSLLEAVHRAIDLVIETAGGQLVGPVFKVGGDLPWQREISLAPAFVRERLGFHIGDDEMKLALESLELVVEREENVPDSGLTWTVAIPSWRDDLERPIDLVEEILRLYGTERIPVTVLKSPGLVGDDDPVVAFNRAVTHYLVGHDFHECVNYTLRPAKELAAWASQEATAGLALANPFVEDQSHLRPTLVTGLLESLKLNQLRGVVTSQLCEAGRVFLELNGQNLECASVGFIVAETPGAKAWLKREPVDFYTVKHHVTQLAALGGVDLSRQPLRPSTAAGESSGWQAGQSATAGEIAYGWTAQFGLLDLAMLKALGIEGKVYAGVFVILPSKLDDKGARQRYRDFSMLPSALRDLALIVDVSVLAGDVSRSLAKIARAAAGSAFALENLEVFDVYQGPGLPEGKKSLAFSLVFRAPDRTLTDDEVNGVFQKIQDDIARLPGYAIRK